MKSFYRVGFALLVGVVLVGCHTEGAYTPKETARYDIENKEPFVLLSAGAQKSVTTSGLQSRRLPDGRLEVAVNVRNREPRRIDVQINCEFKNDDGFTMEATPFQTLILSERAQETVRFISANDQARKYTIRVREAR